MLQIGNRRMRRVSAISDYLESSRKTEMKLGSAEKGERRGYREREKRKKGSELWIAGGTSSNSSNCK